MGNQPSAETEQPPQPQPRRRPLQPGSQRPPPGNTRKTSTTYRPEDVRRHQATSRPSPPVPVRKTPQLDRFEDISQPPPVPPIVPQRALQGLTRLPSEHESINRTNKRDFSDNQANSRNTNDVRIVPQPVDFRIESQGTTRKGSFQSSQQQHPTMGVDPSIRISEPTADERGSFHVRDEINDTGLPFNPYKVMGVPRNVEYDTLRKVYRKLLIENHPDKGGDREVLATIMQSYEYIESLINSAKHARDEVRTFGCTDFDDDQTEPGEGLASTWSNDGSIGGADRGLYKGVMNKNLAGMGKFDANRFNQVFEEMRLDNPLEKGYGTYMVKDKRLSAEESPVARGDEEFDDDGIDYDKQLSTYREPLPFASAATSMSFTTFGVDDTGDIQDFSREQLSSSGQGIAYTDYKRAFHKKSHIEIVDDGTEIKGRPKNLDSLRAERESMSREITSEDRARMEAIRQHEEEQEAERRRRYDERRRLEAAHFSSTHTRMIGGDAPPPRRRKQLAIQN